jgi:hypothetical protein
LDQALGIEPFQETAEITRIEAEFTAEIGCGHRTPMSHFVEHTGFRERKCAFEQSFVQETNMARIEAVEAPDILDLLLRGRYRHVGHGCLPAEQNPAYS